MAIPIIRRILNVVFVIRNFTAGDGKSLCRGVVSKSILTTQTIAEDDILRRSAFHGERLCATGISIIGGIGPEVICFSRTILLHSEFTTRRGIGHFVSICTITLSFHLMAVPTIRRILNIVFVNRNFTAGDSKFLCLGVEREGVFTFKSAAPVMTTFGCSAILSCIAYSIVVCVSRINPAYLITLTIQFLDTKITRLNSGSPFPDTIIFSHCMGSPIRPINSTFYRIGISCRSVSTLDRESFGREIEGNVDISHI